MALQSSGAISLDDIHVEVDGSTGSTCTINDSDIRGLIDKSDGAQSAFNEFYGASNITHMVATGGSTSTSGNYKFHTFTSSGTFTVNTAGVGGSDYTNVDYLIIAGGGAGGQAYTGRNAAGGGGAGGYRTGTVSVTSTGGNTITIGAGHPTASNDTQSIFNSTYYNYRKNVPTSGQRGSDSSALGVTSTGGGIGGARYNNTGTSAGGLHTAPQSGGSGGGMPSEIGGNGASGTSGQGNAGAASRAGAGGGGGGAGSAGSVGVDDGNGGAGGSGSSSGNANTGGTRAGGGGGGSASGSGGSASNGGGAGAGSGNDGSAGSANTGGGGGGAPGYPSGTNRSGGAGGSGLVIVRYKYQN